MKTRNILFSVALCAAFTACTSDDEFKMPAGDHGTDAMLSIRPIAGSEITLDNDVLTRLEVGGGAAPTWSQIDKIGAATIDVPDYGDEAEYDTKLGTASGDTIKLYNIVKSFGCNNAFSTTNGGGSWSAEHPMVEGNYLFYAPYNEDLSLRTPLVVGVPEKQDASGEGAKGALEEFYASGSVVKVGYKFIRAGERQRPVVQLHNIFAYPKFTIKNNFNGYLFEENTTSTNGDRWNGGVIKVDSIQFMKVNASSSRTPDNQFVVGGQLNVGAVSTTAVDQTAGVVAVMRDSTNGFEVAKHGSWNDLDKRLKEVVTTDLIESGKETKRKVITTLKILKDIEQGGSLDVYCVMPAFKFDYSTGQLMAKIYVTIEGKHYAIYEGNFTTPGRLSAVAAEGYLFTAKNNYGLSKLSFMVGQSYPAEAIYLDRNNQYQKKTGVNGLLDIELKGGTVAGDVQIAVCTDTPVVPSDKIKTNEQLIDSIMNTGNGTKWVEGASSSATEKGFEIDEDNTVVINSDLIDALATNNQNEGGSFKIKTVVPVSNDVEVTNVSSTTITVRSKSGKTYPIELDATTTETSGSDASDKYALINATAPSATNDKTVAIVHGTATLTSISALKSLQVIETSGVATLGAALTVGGDVRVDGKLTVPASDNLTAENIYNDGTITLSATVTGDVTNDGTIAAETADAGVTVVAGKGTVTVKESATSENVTVSPDADQEVIYVCDSSNDVDETTIGKAELVPSVNAIKANTSGNVTLKVDDMDTFAHIKTIYPDATITTNENGTYDMSGLTIVLTKAVTWTGLTKLQTIVNNVTVKGDFTLTLNSIAVNGTAEGDVSASGTTATWNGAASN